MTETEFHEWPKWVEPHMSHVVHHGDNISVPGFVEHHVARDGKVTVLCHNADDEKRATSVHETGA